MKGSRNNRAKENKIKEKQCKIYTVYGFEGGDLVRPESYGEQAKPSAAGEIF